MSAVVKALSVSFCVAQAFSAPAPTMVSAIPLHFEPNEGQTDARVRFTARSGGMSIFLTPEETVIGRQSGPPVRMKLRGAKPARFEPLEKLSGVSNYYRGNDPKKWREAVPHYARVRGRQVYDGIDIVYYGNARRLEYDFIVAPHADPSRIELAYEGTVPMRIDSDGSLVLATASGELRQRKPVVYQEAGGKRIEVAAAYRIHGQSVGFELARYDAEKPVVIDPVLEYGTFLGGNFTDEANAMSADATGIWLAGRTGSPDFPRVSPADSAVEFYEGFVTKLNAAGTALVFSTYLGGSGDESIEALATDASGNVFVTGGTGSFDFPVANAFQALPSGSRDAIVARLSPTGALAFSTYLGGAAYDQCSAIALAANGFTLACYTDSPNFLGNTGPTRPLLVRMPLNGAIVTFTKGISSASEIRALATDTAGALYVAGSGGGDAFVAKLNTAGDQWVYNTPLGGSGGDQALALAVDPAGQAYVAGVTGSTDFPTRNAYKSTYGSPQSCCGTDAFLSVLNPAGSALVFSTYFGGGGQDTATHLALLPGGDVVIGGTGEGDLPMAAAWISDPIDGPYFAKFTAAGALVYSSRFGVKGTTVLRAMAPGVAGAVYLAGSLRTFFDQPSDLVVTPGAYDTNTFGTDAFVARFIDGPPPVQITVTSNPVGRRVTVDGRTFTTPAVFSWQPGTPHSLDPNSPQVDGQPQTLYSFASWAHGGAATQSFAAPASATTYTANFTSAPCAHSFTPSVVNAGFQGGSLSAALSTTSPCTWLPQSSAQWLTVSTSGLQTGPASVSFTTGANPGAPRSATITAGTAILTVNQAGGQAILAAPAITSPLFGQTVQLKGLQLAWNAVPGAAGYEVRIFETGGPLVYMGQQTGAGSTSTVVDMADGTFSVYVRACTSSGFGDANCGAYAAVPFTVNMLAPNQSPVILSPSRDQTLRTSTNLISWEPVPGATSYEVTLFNQQTGRMELQINTPTLGTVFTMRSSPYGLTVRGCQAKCSPYQYSSIFFRVELPSLSQTPPTGLTAQITNGNNLDLSWNPVTGADLYRVQVVQAGSGPGGGALTVAAKQVSTTGATLTVPAGAATVVLNACNGDGCGPQSTIAINPGGPNPSAPIVATPIPVVVADGPVVTIRWSRIAGDNVSNTDYRLYVGDLSRDGPALDVITKNNFYGAYLRAEGRRYDALVFATQNRSTVTGPASGFMVGGTSAPAPLITSPTHNSTFKQGTFRLAWSPIPGAVRYQYFVARPGQATPVLTGITPGLFVDTSLAVTANTLHQAIVRACPSNNSNQCGPDSDAGWGPWSNTVTGTTSFTLAP